MTLPTALLDEVLSKHLKPLVSRIERLQDAIDRLDITVHSGDSGQGLTSLTQRVRLQEERATKLEELDKKRRAYVAGFSISLGVITLLAALLLRQLSGQLRDILQLLSGGG